VFYVIALPMILSCVTLVMFHRLTAMDNSVDTLD
jgi:hypothetical protein